MNGWMDEAGIERKWSRPEIVGSLQHVDCNRNHTMDEIDQ